MKQANDNEEAPPPPQVEAACMKLAEEIITNAEDGKIPIGKGYEFNAIYDLIDPPIESSRLTASAYIVTINFVVEPYSLQ